MLTISINDQAWRDQLSVLIRRMGDLTPVLNDIGMELESRISGRFETRTDPDGMPWAPWAQSTLDYYPDGGNKRLLDRYGDMLASLSHQAGSESVTIGFGQPYATYHEWGTKHMPRRGLLMSDPDAGTLSDDDNAAVLDVLNQFLDDLTS